MTNPLDLTAVLQYLVQGGSIVIIAWAVSWGLEGMDWWHALTSKARSLIILGASLVLGVGAHVLLLFPDAIAAIAPYFATIMGTVVAWLGTQAAHKTNPDRRQDSD